MADISPRNSTSRKSQATSTPPSPPSPSQPSEPARQTSIESDHIEPDEKAETKTISSSTSLSRSPTRMDSGAKLAADNLGRTLRSRAARRSLSGIPLTCLFESKFKHFKAYQAAQRDASGLNFLLAPPSGAIYRSSMPVTPISTPLLSNYGLKFNEQTLQQRLLAASLSNESRHGQTTRPFQPNSDIKEEPESQSSNETNDRQKLPYNLRARHLTKSQHNQTNNSEKDNT